MPIKPEEDALVALTRIERDLRIVTWLVAVNIALMLIVFMLAMRL